MNDPSVTRPHPRRRRFSPDFKARIVAQCQEPGASVSRTALDNSLNA
ncbi:MAG: transposase, partial [Saccharospirillum sp.]|nr:transposase [Saccharospirillum sp.]